MKQMVLVCIDEDGRLQVTLLKDEAITIINDPGWVGDESSDYWGGWVEVESPRILFDLLTAIIERDPA